MWRYNAPTTFQIRVKVWCWIFSRATRSFATGDTLPSGCLADFLAWEQVYSSPFSDPMGWKVEQYPKRVGERGGGGGTRSWKSGDSRKRARESEREKFWMRREKVREKEIKGSLERAPKRVIESCAIATLSTPLNFPLYPPYPNQFRVETTPKTPSSLHLPTLHSFRTPTNSVEHFHKGRYSSVAQNWWKRYLIFFHFAKLSFLMSRNYNYSIYYGPKCCSLFVKIKYIIFSFV